MKNFYSFLIGFLTFYFISRLFGGILSTSPWNNFDGVFIVAVLFGILMAFLPTILGFLKIKESNGALLLGGLVINFIFYFLGYYLLKLFTFVEKGKVVFFHRDLAVEVGDKVLGLILISLISSLVIVSLQALGKKK
jgi:hypothetical protein